MAHLLNTIDDLLTSWFNDHGQGKYRVGQVRQWLFQQRARDFSEMTNLSQALRDELARDFSLWSTTIAKHTQAEDGTEKLLLTLADGGQIECVLLRDEVRRTICISTQVGCGMGCVFCASGLDGLDAQSHHRRNRRANAAAAIASRAKMSGSAISSSWAWASRSRISTRFFPR